MKIRNRKELIDHVNYGNSVKYLFFWGHQKPKEGVSKTCFSQWYEAPFEVNGRHFMTAEHYMMYRKATLFNDKVSAEKALKATNPGTVKAIGREVIGFDQQDWEEHRFEIVVAGNIGKFQAHPEMKHFILNTGNRILVEASPVDTIWGIGLAEDNPNCSNPNNWKGENLLGFALMEVRDRLAK